MSNWGCMTDSKKGEERRRKLMASMPVISCPECDGWLCLKYGPYGWFYGCINYPGCRAKHGAHQHGKLEGQPLGRPGDEFTRQCRMFAHNAFDRLWSDDPERDRRQSSGEALRKRSRAYLWLAAKMGLSKAECHISLFDAETSMRVVQLCEQEGHEFLTSVSVPQDEC